MILIEARIKFCGSLVTENFFRKIFFSLKISKISNHAYIPAPGILRKFAKIWKS